MVTLPASLEPSTPSSRSLTSHAATGQSKTDHPKTDHPKNERFDTERSASNRLITDPSIADPSTADPLITDPSATEHAIGQLIVLAGPSGVGKGTLLNQLLKRHPAVQVSVSATTRSPRPGEVDAQHYYFKSREQFHSMIESNELLEWAEFAGNYYGTPKQPIETAIAKGQQVILEIELLGARQVRKSFPNAKQIFVLPPDETILEKRIRSRGQDSEEAIAKRLTQAKVELAAADEFDVQIVNDDLASALSELEAAIFGNAIAQH